MTKRSWIFFPHTRGFHLDICVFLAGREIPGTTPPHFLLKQCPHIRGFNIRGVFPERIPHECRGPGVRQIKIIKS